MKFIYETTPLVPTGGEHILVIDYVSVWPTYGFTLKMTTTIYVGHALEVTNKTPNLWAHLTIGVTIYREEYEGGGNGC